MRLIVIAASTVLLAAGCSEGDRAAFSADVRRGWAMVDEALGSCERDHALYHEQSRNYDRALSCAKRKEVFMDAYRALVASADKHRVGEAGRDFYEALRACEKGVEDFWREDSIYTQNIGDTVGAVFRGIGERHSSADANFAACRSSFREVAAAKGIDLSETGERGRSSWAPTMSSAPQPAAPVQIEPSSPEIRGDAPQQQAPEPSAERKKLYYNGDGGTVTVLELSGADTARSVIRAELLEDDAREVCVEKGDLSAGCPPSLLARTSLRRTIEANCETGEFIDFYGRKFRHQGVFAGSPDPKKGEGIFVITDLSTNKPVRSCMASEVCDYPALAGMIEALCPNSVWKKAG